MYHYAISVIKMASPHFMVQKRRIMANTRDMFSCSPELQNVVTELNFFKKKTLTLEDDNMGNIRESRKQLRLKQRLLLTTLPFFVFICQTFESY
jgi:hypothetical protein